MTVEPEPIDPPRRHPIYRRRRALVIGLVGYLAEQTDPVPWDDLLNAFRTDDLSWKTIENTIRDLEHFGALHRVGKTVRGADTRALLATALGRAWLDQELAPLPGQTDAFGTPTDPFELADAIADTAAEIADLTLDDPFA